MQKLQLTIPEPCHQNWQQMTPTEQGRYCNACAKEVIDFSMMTDTEVLNYFTALTHEKVCGRTLPTQLNREITRPKEPKKRLFWYWNYIVMFFMFFGKANNTKAQGGVKAVKQTEIISAMEPGVRGDVVITKANCTKRSAREAKSGEATRVRLGQVINVDKIATPIYVVDGVIVGTASDINPDDIEDITVLQGPAATALYGSKGAGAIVVTTRKAKEIKLDTVIVSSEYGTNTNKVSGMLGGIRISGVKIEKDDEIITPQIEDNSFKVFPNPVQRGKAITLALNFSKTGLHQIQITDANGRTVFYKRINAIQKIQNEEIVADNRWSSGIYFISIFNNKNELVNKSSFVVQ